MALSLRYGVERGLAGATAVACIITVLWPAWIEAVLGVDPDHGNGWAEWVACGILAGATVALSLLANADRRLLIAAPST